VRVARTRLTLVGALALAVALIASLAAQPGSVLAPERAAAADCAWQQHSKRVVKKVRRHGKLRRVVRWKRWWTCEPLAAAPAPAAPAPAPPTPEPEPEPEANRLSVTAREFYFVLSRPKVKAGSLPVELNNQGADAHNLNIRREGDEGEPLQIPETGSEQRNVASFDLPAGKYRLWCSLPEHEEKGMATTLVVE
jgi:plastocyanin